MSGCAARWFSYQVCRLIGLPALSTAPPQVPGQGAGVRCHGRNTLYPCVGLVANGSGGAAVAAFVSPYGAVTVKPLARRSAAWLGVATIAWPLELRPSVRS